MEFQAVRQEFRGSLLVLMGGCRCYGREIDCLLRVVVGILLKRDDPRIPKKSNIEARGFVGVICRRWNSTESLTPTLLGIDVNGRVMTELHESMDSGFLKVYSLNWGG